MKLAASITDSDTTTIIIDLTKEEFSDLAEIAPSGPYLKMVTDQN